MTGNSLTLRHPARARAGFTAQHRTLGQVAAWAVFGLGMVYAAVLGLGLQGLQSPADSIGEPFFSIMELLILLLVPALVVSLVVHAYARPASKGYSAAALAFMLVLAGITSGVHFVILAVSRPLAATGLAWVPHLLAFRWPSVAYALDILAWDWFFALAMLFAAPVFSAGRLERKVQLLLIASGVLSLAGLLGVPLANMQIRNVGILGYGVVAPVAFLLMGLVFGRAPVGTRPPSSSELA